MRLDTLPPVLCVHVQPSQLDSHWQVVQYCCTPVRSTHVYGDTSSYTCVIHAVAGTLSTLEGPLLPPKPCTLYSQDLSSSDSDTNTWDDRPKKWKQLPTSLQSVLPSGSEYTYMIEKHEEMPTNIHSVVHPNLACTLSFV